MRRLLRTGSGAADWRAAWIANCGTTSTAASSDLMRRGLPGGGSATAGRAGARRPHAGAEEVRDVWLTRWLRDFVYDLRFSARSFLRSPSFTATAVLSLALGIGATTAIYSLVDQVILHALPVREPERLVLIDWKGEPASPTASAAGT